MGDQGSFKRAMMNAVRDRVTNLFPGQFTGSKHNHYADYGWPVSVEFEQFYTAYRRNSLGKAGVLLLTQKTWESQPELHEKEGKHKRTLIEETVRRRFQELSFWQSLIRADRMSCVSGYAGVLLRYRDGKELSEPVERVPGGLDGLVELVPIWSSQLQVTKWDLDTTSDTYGSPLMFSFNEASLRDKQNGALISRIGRVVEVHPDRMFIWSSDGTLDAEPLLEAGYNNLLDMEKVSGAGGEGFWKNAKGMPALALDPSVTLDGIAKQLGVTNAEVAEAIERKMEDFVQGFDKTLLLQGIKLDQMTISLPSPEHFFSILLNQFAASIPIPVKILVGMQTGERASTEDARQWAQTCMSRRKNETIPSLMRLFDLLEVSGVLPEKNWHIHWTDLTEATMGEKIDRVKVMSDVNKANESSGEWVFTPEELREVVDKEPLGDKDLYREDPSGGEPSEGEPSEYDDISEDSNKDEVDD